MSRIGEQGRLFGQARFEDVLDLLSEDVSDSECKWEARVVPSVLESVDRLTADLEDVGQRCLAQAALGSQDPDLILHERLAAKMPADAAHVIIPRPKTSHGVSRPNSPVSPGIAKRPVAMEETIATPKPAAIDW